MSNSKFECPSCGSYAAEEYGNNIICKACGYKYTKNLRDEPVYADLSYAVNKRQEADFDKARRRYDELIRRYGSGSGMEEAYWGRFLCEQYVRFYENDEGKTIPSFWNISAEKCRDSKSFLKALAYGKNSGNSETYELMADCIEEYKRAYLTVCKERPESQIFICFKNTEKDRTLAYRIYHHFAEKYKIFFSPESLIGITGDFEPYIYHALTTARVMIVICSSRDALESQWVHNEWWRFHKLAKGTNKTIIPVCQKDFSPSQLPDEIRGLQSYTEDISLLSDLSLCLDNLFQGNGRSVANMTLFDKDLNGVYALFEAEQIQDADTRLKELLQESKDRPRDHIAALLLQAKIYSNHYRRLNNRTAQDAIARAEEMAKQHDIEIKDMQEYHLYRAAVGRKRFKTALIVMALLLALAGGSYGTYLSVQDPVVDMYITGNPSSIEMVYGSDHRSLLPTITTVSKKGNEQIVEITNSMISGFDPSQIGMQTVEVNYNGTVLRFNINVVKYSLEAPSSISLSAGRITWENVPQAEKYVLQINDTVIENIASNFYDGNIFSTPGIYTIKVKAVADSKVGKDSAYSQTISVISLKEASDLTVSGRTLSWSAIEGCAQYDIYRNGTKIASSHTNTYTVPTGNFAEGENVFCAIPVGANNLKFLDSASEDEIADYEHNGEVKLYKFNQASGLICHPDGKLIWNAVPDASSYDVYLNGKKIGSATTNSYTLTASQVKAGENTAYIIPVGGCNLATSASAGMDFANNGKINLYKYKEASGLFFGADGKLTWNALAAGVTYDVYINDVKVATTTDTFYIPERAHLKAGANLFYVIPVDGFNFSMNGNADTDFEHNSELTLYHFVQAKGLTFNISSSTLSWTSVKGTTKYEIYLNGTLIQEATTASCSLDIGNFTVGENKLYVIPVGGYDLSETEDPSADYANGGEISVRKLPTVTGLSVTNGTILSWNAVEGATEYEILLNGSVLMKTASLSCTITAPQSGVASVYTVRALGGTSAISSDISSESITLTKLSAPQNVTIAEDGTLSWNSVSGAAGYEIYVGDQLLRAVNASTLSVNLLGELERGTYQISVLAQGDGTNGMSSDRSASVQYVVTETIIYISNETDLKNIILDLSATYVLNNDITLTGTWTPLGTTSTPFSGRFDGKGHTISGLNLTATSTAGTGLFGVVDQGGIIKNLVLSDVTANGATYGRIGAVAGINRGTINDVTVSGTISSAGGDYVGGLIGMNYGSVYNCVNHADVEGKKYTGGIAGTVNISKYDILIYGCTNNGAVSGTYRVGGIAGVFEVSKKMTVSDMTNTGNVTSSGEYAGGIFGYTSGSAGQVGSMQNCANTGNITATNYAGGCFGYIGGYITVTTGNISNPELNCTNTGIVTATSGKKSDAIGVK